VSWPWGLTPSSATRPPPRSGTFDAHRAAVIDVTVPSYAGRRRRRGIRLHRSATLTDDQRTTRDAIPVTSVARTLIDIADRFDLRTVERATDQAEVLGLLDLVAVERAIAIGAGRKGSRVMKPLLDEYTAGAGMTESDLEDEFLRLCDRFGIRRPDVQVWFGPDRADFFWPDVNLVVETDSWRWHGGRAAWEADQRKVLRLEMRGLTIRRVSYRRVLCEPAEVAAELELIGAPSEGPRPGE
jgi:very-short-patch-repair endonuclease